MKIPKYSLKLLFLFTIITPCIQSTSPPDRQLYQKNIGCHMTTSSFHSFLKSGFIKGYFTSEQFWYYFHELQSKYSKYIGHKIPIGQTYLGNTMYGFYMGQHLNDHSVGIQGKNIVFITGLHHSREPLTVTMVLFLMIKILKESGVCGDEDPSIKEKWTLFFNNNVIFFIPIVNEDSYKYIGENWQGPHAEDVLMIRKNRNISAQCDEFTGGVDLNRNYSFMFGLNDSGSSGNPCEEDFRGSHPFSEPETQAIKHYVESHPTIVTGINMHTYGNAWIFPFNFVHDSHNHLLEKKKPKFYNFYKEFVNDMRRKHEKADYGNAQGTVQYPTNGEAGDWMTEEHNIINLDVELGNLDKRSDGFYPPKSIIPNICEYNFKVFRQFFWKHNIDLELHQVKRNLKKRTLTFVIFNKSVSSLINFSADVYPLFKMKRKIRSLKKSRKSRKNKKRSRKKNKRKFQYKKERKLSGVKNRKLSESKNYELKYATKANCTFKTKGFTSASDNTIKGTLKGRYFLEIQFKFDNQEDLEDFEAINLDVHYGHGYTKKYEFKTFNRSSNKVFSKSHNKIYTKLLKRFSIFQERKLKVNSGQLSPEEQKNLQDQARLEKRAKDLPKLIV